jgi:hypothetical protein
MTEKRVKYFAKVFYHLNRRIFARNSPGIRPAKTPFSRPASIFTNARSRLGFRKNGLREKTKPNQSPKMTSKISQTPLKINCFIQI